MSDMADRDHIAITSGDASTTRCKFLYRDARLLRRSLSLRVILSDTYRRIAPDSEILPGLIRRRPPGTQFACSNSVNARQRLCARIYMAMASSHSPRAAPSMAARISATD
jgi:hypothetical protein